MNKTKNITIHHDKNYLVPRSKKFSHIAPVAVTASLVLMLIVMFSSLGLDFKNRYLPWVDVVQMIKYEASSFHLRLEEEISGQLTSGHGESLDHISNALELSQYLMIGGNSDEGIIERLPSGVLYEAAKKLSAHLEQLKDQSFERSGISDGNQKTEEVFHHHYMSVLGIADEIEDGVREELAIAVNQYLFIGFISSFLIVLSATGISVAIWRYEVRLEKSLMDIHKSKDDLMDAQMIAKSGSWKCNLQSKKFECTPAASNIIGISQESCSLNGLLNMFSSAQRELVGKAFLNTGANAGDFFTFDLTLFRLDGTKGDIHLSGRFQDNGDIVGTIQDITEQKNLERMKDNFVSTVVHELRTPLTSIKGAVDLLSSGAVGDLPSSASKLLETASRNSERLVRMISEVLDIAKSESGKLSIDASKTEIVEELRETIQLNQTYAKAHNVLLRFSTELDVAYVNLDSNRFQQVMANLISNAIKYSPSGEEVEVELRKNGAMLKVMVTDHGKGIPLEFRDMVFQKFVQSKEGSSSKVDSTGLGLGIAKDLVEGMGGKIYFDSAENLGTTFICEFQEIQVLEKGFPWVREYTGHILVVEDDHDIAMTLKKAIESDGFYCDVAYSAAEAKTFASHKGYDAICLDLALPDQDGLSMLEELRQFQGMSDIPVVVISGFANEVRQSAEDRGCVVDQWVSKPFDIIELKKTIGEAATRLERRIRVLKIGPSSCNESIDALCDDTVCMDCVKNPQDIANAVSAGGYDAISLSPGVANDPEVIRCLEKAVATRGIPMMPIILDDSESGSCGVTVNQQDAIKGIRSLLLGRMLTRQNLKETA